MTRPLLAIPIAILAAALAVMPRQAIAQDLPAPAGRKTPLLGEVIVIGVQADEDRHASSLREHDIAHRRTSTSDSASLLRNLPGVSVYGAGGISGLPAVHGLADDRLRTQVDGMDLASACPNHMNPALSFIDPAKIATIKVFAGIAPVSVGGDSIGGTIQVESAPPKFAGAGERWLAEGRAGFFSRSNDNAHGQDFALTLAGSLLSLAFTGSNAQADNYRAAGDFKKPGAWQTFSGGRRIDAREVAASEYRDARNREFSLAVQPLAGHMVEFRLGRQQLDHEGFPNQRMDMVSSLPDPLDPLSWSLDKRKPANVNRLASVRYSGRYGWGALEAQLSRQRLHHHMDLLPERYFHMLMPMDTDAKTDGGKIGAHIDLGAADVLRIGYEFQNYQLNDWWPPVNTGVSMCCQDFRNIHDGRRDRAGLFVEWEKQWSADWLGLLGVRGESVSSGAGKVQGYSGSYAGDASRFNAGSRSRRDRHLDWTALARYTPDAHQTYEAGIARKMRSPNLYERYAWSYNTMAALMNNFVGDGNGYIGDPELEPETAHTLSISGDWHDAGTGNWQIKVTGYLTQVRDFIDAGRCTPAMNTQCTALNATTTNSYVKLRYVNQSARLYGMDIAGETALGSIAGIGSFTLSGMMSHVRGRNRSTGDDLYHLMPLDTRLALVHRRSDWSGRIEVESVAAKTRVSQVRNEAPTPAYTLLNLYGSYAWKHVRLDVALDNALDKFYLQPLGGAYLGQGNPMTIGGIPWGMVVPGRGRSFNVALSVDF